jgi:hypothetical protein
VDGEIAAEQLFDSYANLMDREFPLPWVEAKGTDLGDGWVQCGICQDAFQANRQDAMAFCDKCNKLIHNPLYESPTLPGIGPRH